MATTVEDLCRWLYTIADGMEEEGDDVADYLECDLVELADKLREASDVMRKQSSDLSHLANPNTANL